MSCLCWSWSFGPATASERKCCDWINRSDHDGVREQAKVGSVRHHMASLMLWPVAHVAQTETVSGIRVGALMKLWREGAHRANTPAHARGRSVGRIPPRCRCRHTSSSLQSTTASPFWTTATNKKVLLTPPIQTTYAAGNNVFAPMGVCVRLSRPTSVSPTALTLQARPPRQINSAQENTPENVSDSVIHRMHRQRAPLAAEFVSHTFKQAVNPPQAVEWE